MQFVPDPGLRRPVVKAPLVSGGRCRCRPLFIIVLLIHLTVPAAVFSQELPLRIGDERNAVISRLGRPNNTRVFKSGTERLYFSDLMVDLRDKRVAIIRSTGDYRGTIHSVRLGDTPARVTRLLGEPDQSDRDQLIYFNFQGNYLRYNLDKQRKVVSAIFIAEGRSAGEIARREKQPTEPAAREVMPSDQDLRENLRRRAGPEPVTEKEYRRRKLDSERESLSYQTFTGRLREKNSVLSPVEAAQGMGARWEKFVVEHRETRDGVAQRILRECFIDRSLTSLRNKLDALSVGDTISVRGRWRRLETKSRQEKEGLEMEKRMATTVFVVERLQ